LSSPYLITGISQGTLEPVGYFAAQGAPGNDNLLYFPSSSAFDSQGLTFLDAYTFNLYCTAVNSCFVYGGTFNPATFTVTEVTATPLPAALPLFAGGLGALGLLAWRRKRKNAAFAAA
jgi:hypothetical protein